LGKLCLVITKGSLPTLQVSWPRGCVSSSRSGDFISELSDQSDDFFNGGTISGFGEHGQGVDKWKIGGVLTESFEFLGNFF